MNEHSKNLIYIHLSIFLFGFSALFARLIDQHSVVITFGRVFFSSLFLFALIKCSKSDLKFHTKKDFLLIICSGIILAVHWFCFFASIQLSTIAIGTITFSTFPIFVSIIEPVVFRERIEIRIVICSVIMLLGILIITPINNSQESIQKIIGIITGLASGLSYAVLSLLNRNFSVKYKSEIIVFYEQAIAAVVLLPFMFVFKPIVALRDVLLLAIFGIIFTAIAHGLFVKGLRYVKVSTAGIISGLEAVYAIVLASFLLKETPVMHEVIGGLIVVVLAGYVTLSKNLKKENTK